MRYILLTLTAFALLACAQTPAEPPKQQRPQSVCGDRQDVMTRLGEGYLEERRGAGLSAGGGVLEFWRTLGGETWTVFLSLPNGVACLIAAGEAWQDVEPEPKGRGS